MLPIKYVVLADFVFRFSFTVTPYSVMQHYNIITI